MVAPENGGAACPVLSESQACNLAPCSTYAWTTGAWTACTAECGGGLQARTVECRDQDGALVAVTLCDAGTKPATEQPCNADPCPAAWFADAWEACPVTCGGGEQTRLVECRDSRAVAVGAERCSASEKPAVSQACGLEACPSHSWKLGDWSSCSATCGGGTRTRTVTCQDATGLVLADAHCAADKPAGSEACNPQACATYAWTTGDWSECSTSCGVGTQARVVTCASNSGGAADEALCPPPRPSATQDCEGACAATGCGCSPSSQGPEAPISLLMLALLVLLRRRAWQGP